MEITERKLMAMGLPPGFRFHPTDEELVVQYLRRKVLSFPLPASIIPEVDLANYDPWDLPGPGGSVEGERYLFNRREAAHAKGKQSSTQPTKSGYWKAAGKDRPVMVTSKHGIRQVAGMKKVLVFHHGNKSPHGCKTHWIMHEYRLTNLEAMASSISSNNRKIAAQLLQGKNWVVCRIFTKKKRAAAQQHNNLRASNDHHMSLEASCVTDALDQECSKGEEASSKFVAPSP